MFHIDPNVLTKGNARFQTLLHINVDSSNPDDYIARFGSKLNMDYNDLQTCKQFAVKLDDLEIVSENAPTSVAAGALYYYCLHRKINVTKKQIAEVCEVSEVTITKCYKRLTKSKEQFKTFFPD
jgi:transcription initiation factor TFIIB